ncbi:ABC transporter substrate-binding protein [Aliikangiella coralliicola]|uniref:ABC transporter substrate-binding protein n=2 Tax=Aliikangiella coralliicola TaxID=2592383 RepID=A0A545UCN4_9GAMM|nr:ABC transporter substrate-binding protein [Aliikangiella coralliicola]
MTIGQVQATTRSVFDALGNKVQVPVEPKKVVALSEIDYDSTLALRIAPSATIRGRGQGDIPRYLKPIAKQLDSSMELSIVGDIGRPNLEKIIELQPDLIITSQQRPGVMKQLSLIAPTVVTAKRGESWREIFARIATVLNRESEAGLFLEQYHQRLEDVKTNLKNSKNSTVSIVRWNPKGPAYMFNDSFASLIVRDLKLQRPKVQQQKGYHHSRPLSLEALHQIDADWIFLGTLDGTGDAVDAMQVARNSEPFKQLKASRQNQVIPVDGSLWTSVGGPLAALQVLKDIEQAMLKRSEQPAENLQSASIKK